MTGAVRQGLLAYGRDFTVYSDACPQGRRSRGVLRPLALSGETAVPRSLMPGVTQRMRYQLVAPPEAFFEEETNTCIVMDGARFSLRQAALRYLGEEPSHWEVVLRREGGRSLEA